ncbi:glycosyltransferase [Pseudozyma hubeiensis SY62]|uniref:Glycosyltransferase n=1 Tax=Pseudozyma hubeiensis (strain SY62) TaxID=1305764 RepID=R9NYP7_PSEHS|nr:glycosyltransferase [Pseudozyma hubeiensis SY62]GAC93933.1 glycosyltransferase [Pseudozyma hubeiensis SY62]
MPLCPRAAAQALHSPPELQQQEHKDDAAYFDHIDNSPYTLQPPTQYGSDQEPLLESQSAQIHTISSHLSSETSILSRCMTQLLRASFNRFRSSSAPTGSMPRSRKPWLPILLLANLVVTAVCFVAACIHFNTFTTLFLYLASLVVAFPLLSFSLCAAGRTSHNYKLQLPDLSPNSTPLSEQSISSFSDLFGRSSTPVPQDRATPAAVPSRRRFCRSSHLESLARSALYIGAILWLLAVVEWILFQPSLPTRNDAGGGNFRPLVNASLATDTTPAPPIKVFIVSNLYNSEEILPTYASSLKTLIRTLGTDNVFVSIYESHSTDQTKSMLAQLDHDLAQVNVSRRILSDDRAIRKGKLSAVSDRIRFLVDVRNTAMQPLLEATDKYTHVLWINDIVFTPQDALTLLRTNNGRYDQACAIDFIGNGFYDTWVTRDAHGDTLKRQWPYFKRDEDVEAMRKAMPFEVNSCWNGISAFDAKWFYPASKASEPASLDVADADEDGPSQLPLKFRASKLCLSSECQLISYDIHRATFPSRPLVLINPGVKVAYNHRHYWLYNSLIPSPILRPWRIIWRDWIGNRLFGWVTEGLRWSNECKSKQKFWAAAPAMSTA